MRTLRTLDAKTKWRAFSTGFTLGDAANVALTFADATVIWNVTDGAENSGRHATAQSRAQLGAGCERPMINARSRPSGQTIQGRRRVPSAGDSYQNRSGKWKSAVDGRRRPVMGFAGIAGKSGR